LAENDHNETGYYWYKTKIIEPNPISKNRSYSSELTAWADSLIMKGNGMAINDNR
jgi:hypothetical protein